MRMRTLTTCGLLSLLLIVGCGSADEQELSRFNLDRPADVGVADGYRSMISVLKQTLAGEGGTSALSGELTTITEDTASRDMSKLSEEDQATAQQIEDLLGELQAKAGSASAKEIGGMIAQMEALAAKLPTGSN